MPATAKKILVALSGGVDSSVCVHLLKKQGYEVIAAVMSMSDAHKDTVSAAQNAADTLGVPLHVLDMRAQFETNVIDYFVREYASGNTPNPCIVCNPLVKFAALATLADSLGCELIATGHYASIVVQDGVARLARGECHKRDQSYMLYRLPLEILSRLVLPLSSLAKDEVRSIAASIGLDCATSPDSQEICFIPNNDYAAFIERRIGTSPRGEFIAPDGSVCGIHGGIIHYTVGQRKGLGIALGVPVYISKIDPISNQIFLAKAGEDLSSTAAISSVILHAPIVAGVQYLVKIRSVATPVPATISQLFKGSALVQFATPQRAVARGQSIVIYLDNLVVGGGFVT